MFQQAYKDFTDKIAMDMDKLRDTMVTNLKKKPDVVDLDAFMNRLEMKKADAATV